MRTWWFIGMLLATSARAQIVWEALEMQRVEDCLPAVLGADRAFSAVVTVRAGGESLEMRLITRAGKVRAELDVDHVNLQHFGGNDIEMLKQIGLGQVTEIVRPDKGFSYIVLPLPKVYCEARPQDVGQMARPKLRIIQKVATGEKEINRHPCAVNEITLAAEGDDQPKLQVTTWEAKDLKNFPLQIMVHGDGDAEVTVEFREVDLESPDEWLFDAPVGWRHYPGIEQMMEDRLQRLGGMFMH